MTVTTRPAGPDDGPFVVDCYLRAMRPSLTAWRGDWNERREREQFEETLDVDRTTVISADGSDVGFVMIVEAPRLLQLHTLCIAPEHQRRGIGGEVVRDLIAVGRQTGRDVMISVLKVNPRAEALYARLGFTVFEETAHHRLMRHTR